MSKCDQGGGEPPPPAAEQDLQDILDDLVVSGPPLDASSPSAFETFLAGSTGITAQVVVSTDPGFLFGLYDGDDPHNLGVMLGGDFPTSFVSTVSFSDEGTITLGSKPNAQTRSGFDGPFGFFVKVIDDDSTVFIFTEAALNTIGGAKVFQGNGETTVKLPGLQAGIFRPDQFILAFDADGDGVFGDMVVMIAGIDVAVPEPASALLIGLSLLALVRLRRS